MRSPRRLCALGRSASAPSGRLHRLHRQRHRAAILILNLILRAAILILILIHRQRPRAAILILILHRQRPRAAILILILILAARSSMSLRRS